MHSKMANIDKSALRYKILDKCLKDFKNKWSLKDIIEKISIELGGEKIGVRTLQLDIHHFRAYYSASIEVYNGKYYRYEFPEFSIFKSHPSEIEIKKVKNAFAQLHAITAFENMANFSESIDLLEHELSRKLALEKELDEENASLIYLKVAAEFKNKLQLNPIHSSQQIISENESNIKIAINTVWNAQLESKILSYGKDIQVISPKEFRKNMVSIIKKMKKMYED